MAESHPIRNSIVGTVVGGLILGVVIKPTRALLAAGLWWILDVVAAAMRGLLDSYATPGWVLVLMGGAAFLVLVRFGALIRKRAAPSLSYTTDVLFGARWGWSYSQGNITSLWCRCPRCETDLVYEERPQGRGLARREEPTHTLFICERCKTVCTKLDGYREDALGTVQREITRRLRTNEWKPAGSDA